MTTIAPWTHASQLATDAQSRLATAANLLRSDAPFPMNPDAPIRVGIPEQNGPDSPDNPFFVAPQPIMPPHLPNVAALRLAGGAVTAIEQALAMGTHLSAGVTLAFQRAKDEALAGVRMIEAPQHAPIDTKRAPLQFDAAGMWLGLAKSLIALDHPSVMPGDPGLPITIEPIIGDPDLPVGPGLPITIKPIEDGPGAPVTIKPIDA